MDNSFLLDAMDWSYSRVSSFDQCPRMVDLTYLQCMDRVDNAFAQWGSLAHSLLERYFRQQVELWDLSGLYEKEYARAVTERFPFPRLEGIISVGNWETKKKCLRSKIGIPLHWAADQW